MSGVPLVPCPDPELIILQVYNCVFEFRSCLYLPLPSMDACSWQKSDGQDLSRLIGCQEQSHRAMATYEMSLSPLHKPFNCSQVNK
jgi:hypothetical protein